MSYLTAANRQHLNYSKSVSDWELIHNCPSSVSTSTSQSWEHISHLLGTAALSNHHQGVVVNTLPLSGKWSSFPSITWAGDEDPNWLDTKVEENDVINCPELQFPDVPSHAEFNKDHFCTITKISMVPPYLHLGLLELLSVLKSTSHLTTHHFLQPLSMYQGLVCCRMIGGGGERVAGCIGGGGLGAKGGCTRSLAEATALGLSLGVTK